VSSLRSAAETRPSFALRRASPGYVVTVITSKVRGFSVGRRDCCVPVVGLSSAEAGFRRKLAAADPRDLAAALAFGQRFQGRKHVRGRPQSAE
jgi:hypothetical protein